MSAAKPQPYPIDPSTGSDVCHGCRRFLFLHDHERSQQDRPACSHGGDGRYFYNDKMPPIAIVEEYQGEGFGRQVIDAGVIEPGGGVLDNVADAEGVFASDEPATEEQREAEAQQFIDPVADGPVMLEVMEEAIGIALWHLERNRENLSLAQAKLAHAGITYLTYIADSIGQRRATPARTARSTKYIRAAAAFVVEIARRPRVIALDKQAPPIN